MYTNKYTLNILPSIIIMKRNKEMERNVELNHGNKRRRMHQIEKRRVTRP